MYVTAIASQSPDAAYEASLGAFTPSTLAQYFRCVRVFLAFARALDVSVGDLQLVHMVDLTHACDGSRAEDRTSVRISPAELLECIGNWKAAEAEPDTVSALLNKEIASGWIVRTDMSVEDARRHGPKASPLAN